MGIYERTSAKEPDPHHRLPELESKERRRPGWPKGAKNILPKIKKEASTIDKPKRKPSRPKGARNKKTLEKEALAAAQVVKRGSGRPKEAEQTKAYR